MLKSGDARVAMIGFPSVGKVCIFPGMRSALHHHRLQSTLLGQITNTESATAAYEFTTLTCIPGVIEASVSTHNRLITLIVLAVQRRPHPVA